MSSKLTGVCCAVVGCHNNRRKLNIWKETLCEIHEGEFHKNCPCIQPFNLHRFPKQEKAKQLWIVALQRKNYKPGKSAVVCGIHFVGGIKTKEHSVPTLHLGHNKEIHNRNEIIGDSINSSIQESESDAVTSGHAEHDAVNNENLDIDTFTQTGVIMKDAWTQYEDPVELRTYSKRNNNIEFISTGVQANHQHFMRWDPSKISDKDCKFYTGLSLNVFRVLVSGLSKCAKIEHNRLSVFDQIFIVLVRLRLGLLYGDLSRISGVSPTVIRRIVKFWIAVMAFEMKVLIQWLPRETIKATMPPLFKELYPTTTCIVDCMKIYTEKPKLLYRRATYSQYKYHNTFKFLIAIAPNGMIMFVSDCYGGRASGKFITANCGILNYLLPGDNVMIDRRFAIQDLLPPGVLMNIPSFILGRQQLPEEDVTMCRRISSLRVDVARAIRKLRRYRILKGILTRRDIDNIIFVCAALCNLQEPIIKQSD